MLLGLDIGTSSIKAVLYHPDQGRVVKSSFRATPVIYPQTGWSEHDPHLLWEAVVECIREVVPGQAITALAISSMAETGLLIDRNGQPVSSIIAWYDRRSESQAAWIEENINSERLFSITGQRVSPSFGLTKILWLKQNQPDAFRQAAHWLPTPTYILWRLSGQMAVDYTIAARTLAFDQRTLTWSKELLGLADLSEDLFPHVYPGHTIVGPITQIAAEETGLSPITLCGLGGHDHLCAAFATGANTSGAVTDSTGSANALLYILPNLIDHPLIASQGFACYPHVLRDYFVLKGGLKAAGSAIEWLARSLSGSGHQPNYQRLETDAEQGIGKRAGPIWLPHLIGSGTPEADRFSRAALIGVQFEHSPGDLFRGLLESLAFWTRHNLEEIQTTAGLKYGNIMLTGGATRMNLLSRLKANIINHPITVPKIPETAAVGAALLAGLGAGTFSDSTDALSSLRYNIDTFSPDEKLAGWYNQIYEEVYRPLYSTLSPLHHALNKLG